MNRSITFTPRELEMIMNAIETHIAALESNNQADPRSDRSDEINEFDGLLFDLVAESAGHHDDWPHIHFNGADEDSWEHSAEAHMIDAGIDARERMKRQNRDHARAFVDSDLRTGSLAVNRRAAALQSMMAGTATPVIVTEED
jgi:hypothetical protein